MKTTLSLFPLFVGTLLLLSTGCAASGGGVESFGESIDLTWELKTNFGGNGRQSLQEFVFTNRGTKTLGPDNWALYFTQNNAPIAPLDSEKTAKVEHVNGYLYRLTPTSTFALHPGGTIKVTYLMEAVWGKVTDAPGAIPYFVFNEGKADEEVVPVKNYSVVPFTREEQLMLGPDDLEPIMTPARRYLLNSVVTPVPADRLPRIIPMPVEYKPLGGEIALDENVRLIYPKELKNEADYLVWFIRQQFGMNLPAAQSTTLDGTAGAITLKTSKLSVNGIENESYALTVSPSKGVVIEGNDPAGVFYGIQSLIQLLPVELFKTGPTAAVALPCVSVKDAPRFGYRGQHFDVSRHFHSVKKLKHFIDIMAHYKLNRLDLRLTEDEGWRLEIPGLPELTEIGSLRGHGFEQNKCLVPAFGSGPTPNDPAVYGNGYYTRADFIELIRYAAQRHVTLVPEICYPSHVMSAIVAMEHRYEKYMKEGDKEKAEEYRLRDPDDRSKYLSAQMFHNNVACMGMESTYRFYDKVVGEIKKMYDEAGVPMEWFHTGGDELPAGAWLDSPLCKPFLDQLPGAKSTTNLNTVCFDRLVAIVRKYAPMICGWEEVGLRTDDRGHKYPNPQFAGKGIVPFVWNNLSGDEDLGYRLANAGYPVVLCNVSNFYFDLAADKDPLEPGLTWGGLVNTKDAFYFAPFDMFKTTVSSNRGRLYGDSDFKGKELLRPEARKNILGLQAELWSETLVAEERIDYMLLPKLIGFSVSAWSPERRFERIDDRTARINELDLEWNLFANAVGRQDLKRLDVLFGGYGYRIDPPGAEISNGILKANNEFPAFDIRYTTDGTEPTLSSPLYQEAVAVTGTVKLKSFNQKGRSSRTTTVE